MSTTSSFPSYTVATGVNKTGVGGAGVSVAILGGAAAGGMLLVLIITVGIVLAILFAIRR